MSQRARRGAGEDVPQAAGTWWSLLQRRRWLAWQNGPRTKQERPPQGRHTAPHGDPRGHAERHTCLLGLSVFRGCFQPDLFIIASHISVLLKSDLPKEKSSKRPSICLTPACSPLPWTELVLGSGFHLYHLEEALLPFFLDEDVFTSCARGVEGSQRPDQYSKLPPLPRRCPQGRFGPFLGGEASASGCAGARPSQSGHRCL